MNTSTMRLIMAAAALVVAAGSASAQTLKAEIPMSFHAAGKVLPAGSYEIRQLQTAGGAYVVVRSLATYNSVVLPQGVKGDAPKAWRADGSPRLAFECLGSTCSLQRMWNGRDEYAYKFPTPKAHGDIAARETKVITLAMVDLH
ncbi:conserved exported hypothetical protein [Candidatus Sulfopaludibacter sp. SbA3]|nr:conserved exported hypothetical protein [Candidatus Sulfopaludibacter sp. SbA3]